MHAAIIADDLTGAADTGVQLVRAGYRTAVAFGGDPLPPAEDLDAVALDTDSRAMPAGFAAKRVLEAGRAVRNTRVVYKKLDATLRGPNAAQRLGAVGIRLEGEVEPGVPVGTLIGPRPYRVVTKAGGFGDPATLLKAVQRLLKGGKELG